MTRLWGGRFEAETAPQMQVLSRSTHFDVRLARQDCRVLAAHAAALHAAGILTAEEAGQVAQALPAIGEEIHSGAFAVDLSDEDVHTAVERGLAERAPAVAPKVRAGLSRNDRVATAFRLWILDAIDQLSLDLTALISSLTQRARQHQHSIMPGYTHLQRAQPVTLGYTLAARALALTRDATRLQAARASACAMPLGAGALAGSTLGLDRQAAASRLGFDRIIQNSLDAVSSRDFAAELLAACAILGVNLSGIGEEIVLWTTSEFAFASLDDAFATGSSLMPQKKNPDVAELARGKSGRLIGNLTGFLAACASLPLAYNRDLQEDKEPVFDSIDTLAAVLPALAGAIATMHFDQAAMRAAAADPMLLATDLAELLVVRGVPFKEAHEAVGHAVRDALARGVSWRDFTADDWTKAHPLLAQVARGALDVESSVRTRLGDTDGMLTDLEQWVAAP